MYPNIHLSYYYYYFILLMFWNDLKFKNLMLQLYVNKAKRSKENINNTILNHITWEKKQISIKYHITYFRANDFCKLWLRIYYKHNKKPRNDLEVFYKWEI